VAVKAQEPPSGPAGAATSRRSPWTVLQGDCTEALATLEVHSVDAVVCDPPYGIGILGCRWDGAAIREAATREPGTPLSAGEAYQAWCRHWAATCLPVMKPGAHLAAFGSPRTAHRLACALEEAGFELRDTLMWLYGTGLPKSRHLPGGRASALKPAHEPILLARRPPQGTLQQNLKAHGTGALNTEACRVEGRFPANIIISHEPECDPGECAAGCAAALADAAAQRARTPSGSPAGASRLFYCPKASRAERDAGCEQLPLRALDIFPNAQGAGRKPPPAANPHPTVKPLELMRWLIRLTAPPGGLVLDPFCGSGTTGAAAVLERRLFLGTEIDPQYAQIARARIAHWARHGDDGADEREASRGPFARRQGAAA
jgi:DNA modification methylase